MLLYEPGYAPLGRTPSDGVLEERGLCRDPSLVAGLAACIRRLSSNDIDLANMTALFPTDTPDVSVAQVFGNDLSVYLSEDAGNVQRLLANGYTAVHDTVKTYLPRIPFGVLVATSPDALPSRDQCARLVRPGGLIVASSHLVTGEFAADLMPGGTIVPSPGAEQQEQAADSFLVLRTPRA